MSAIKVENKLDYSDIPDYSLCHTHRYRSFSASNKVYSDNSTIEIRLNLSDRDFIECSKSYVTFNLLTKSATGTHFPLGEHGSALKFFRTIQLIAKDGTIIDIHNNVFQYATTSLLFKKNVEWVQSNAYGFLYQTDVDKDRVTPVVIPLDLLVSLFTYDNLLPPSLMDGMSIRFTLANIFEVVVDSDLNQRNWTYQITNFKAVLNTYAMDKMAIDQLDKETLSIGYNTYHYKLQEFPYNDVAKCVDVSMPIHFECDKAIRAFALSTPQAATEIAQYATDFAVDNQTDLFGLAPYTGVRWRVGQTYTDPLDTRVEQLARAKDAFNTTRAVASMAVNAQLQAVDLTRSAVQKGGTPIDNNNGLVVEFRKKTEGPLHVHLFLEYYKKIIL